jgi:hypothetical protein
MVLVVSVCVYKVVLVTRQRFQVRFHILIRNYYKQLCSYAYYVCNQLFVLHCLSVIELAL